MHRELGEIVVAEPVHGGRGHAGDVGLRLEHGHGRLCMGEQVASQGAHMIRKAN